MTTQIHVFGPMRVLVNGVAVGTPGFSGRKPRQVLQILAAHGGRTVSKDRLADLLWHDVAPGDPSGAVEHYVALARRALRCRQPSTDSVIRTEGAGYVLDLERARLDLADFTRAVGDVSTWLHRDRVRAALALSDFDVFGDEPYASWALDVRDEVRQQRCDLLVRAAELGLADADPRSAVADALSAIEHEPHLESAYRVMIAAHYLAGDQARALAAYSLCRRRLVDDLGIEPSPHTQELHTSVLRHGHPDDVLRRLTIPAGRRTA
jgi:DNA-binding SARP family transcriptional activator